MDYMFCNCVELTSINTNIFKTNKVISLSETFSNCKNLQSLNLSHFETPNVKSLVKPFLVALNWKQSIFRILIHQK